MSKFDEEVNKILLEANFINGLKTFAQGAEGLLNTAAPLAGASFSVNKDVYSFLDSINKDIDTPTKYDTLKIDNVLSKMVDSKEDTLKTNQLNDFLQPKNKIVIKKFLDMHKNYTLKNIKKSIKSTTKTIINNLNKKIVDTDLNKFSTVSISNTSSINDVNTFLKWLFSLHKNQTYKEALNHFFVFLLNTEG